MRYALLVCAALAMSGSAANAAISTQTLPINAHNPNQSGNLVFDLFDSTLGTLNSVTITSTLLSWGGSFAVDNDAATPASGTASLSATLSLSADDVRLPGVVKSLATGVTESFELAANDGDAESEYNAGTTDWGQVLGPSSGSPWSDSESAVATYMNDYIGAGTFTISYSTVQSQAWAGNGGISGAFTAMSASGSVTVTYDYTPVPEPATASLAGLAVLMLLRRRRRA